MENSHTPILALLAAYSENLAETYSELSDAELKKEKETIARFVSFINSTRQPFSRQNLEGHFCGSAWVLDKEWKRVVLTHHAKLEKWIQLGGHADDDTDLFQVALKEAHEESGLKQIAPLTDKKGRCLPFDFTIHEIPENKGVPAHLHYDVTYVFVAKDDELVCSDESFSVRWFTFEEAAKVSGPETRYQLRKLQYLLKSRSRNG